MPTKPLSPCTVPGCPALVARPGKCPRHRREADRALKMNHPWRDYGVRHEGLRRRVLREEPTCRACGRERSAVADHVVPLCAGGRTERSNMQGLCARCHNRKTARENGFGGQG